MSWTGWALYSPHATRINVWTNPCENLVDCDCRYELYWLGCLLVLLHDFLDHLDGIVAKVQRRVLGNVDDPLLGGFMDAFCDKVSLCACCLAPPQSVPQGRLVGWLLIAEHPSNMPVYIRGGSARVKLYVLPHREILCRPNFLSHPFKVYWRRAN